MDEDHILGFDEIEVSQKDAKCQLAEKWVEKTVTDSELQVSEDDTQIHIKGREFAYTIDRRTALFTEMKFAGREYLNHPMELNIWRAPTDNDMYIMGFRLKRSARCWDTPGLRRPKSMPK